MAAPVQDVSVNGLRIAHFKQLLAYAHECDIEGWYYGREDQFRKRYGDITEWLTGVIERYEAAS